MPFINGLLKKKGLQQLVQYCYLQLRPRDDRRDARRLKNLGFLYATTRASRSASTTWSSRGEGRARRRARETRSSRSSSSISKARSPTASATTRSSRSGRRSPRRSPTRCSREMEELDDRGPPVQPGLHHGRLRRPRQQAADPPARRHARPDGQAVGRNHRDADHGELPRRAHRAAVLHLDARRPQGSGRHRAQDRRLGLPDAPARGRGAGRDHLRERLRHGGRHRGASRSSRAARSSSRCATASSAASRSRRSTIRSTASRSSTSTRRSPRSWRRRFRRPASRGSKIRSVLTCASRRGVCAQVLRPQPGARAGWSSSARRSASSRRSRSASRARS